jgi:hypothetical protein
MAKYGDVCGRHNFVFNKGDNGGEALALTSTFVTNGEGEVWAEQELVLHCYANAATIRVMGLFTPESLRKLAAELEYGQKLAEAEARR